MPCALIVFTASGFAGLIYESLWSHYLKLFLGHAAYAQSLVLAIFMGGMALGAWAASRFAPRLRDCLLAYALIEALIGLASLVFHDVFVASTALAFDRIIPALGSPAAIQAFKWGLGAALLLPQSVLLGATFPLMTGGVLRLRPERSGYVVAMLYFTNSLGASVGVLVSGFYLIEAATLPGALAAAGVINLAVALAVMLLRPAGGPAPALAAAAAPAAPPRLRMLLAVAALTGASSFFYEIGWIRMLSLVLGASTHAFELMLSAFILGIACGGLAIRRRIDATADPLRLLGWVQLAMGLAALATLPVYGSTFLAMEAAMQALSPTVSGYVAFNVVSHGLCLAVMFPAAFCAGMTLPLITAALLRSGAGERAVGQVYAANTAGSIVGVLLAVHLGFTLLGLKGVIVAGAAVDLGLGVLLLAMAAGGRRIAYASASGVLAVAAVVATLAGVQLDAQRMASGVFRTGSISNAKPDFLLQLDGKTATVTLKEGQGILALLTNGKSDGSVRLRGEGGPVQDEVFMTLLGALPQFLKPEARQVANIGFGTGMTTHVLLASPAIESLDTVEIEPAIVQASTRFRPVNARAYDDPRSHIRYDDAKTYFSARQQRYDVIVSEPSNPWVSGVSGLFTTEFYSQMRRYLNDDGLFVQWVHVYEMTPVLIATIMGALAENFSDYELWMANHGDLVVVAAKQGRVPQRLDARAFANPRLRAELERFNIRNLDDLLLHRVGGRAALGPYYGSFGAPVNSDFAPVLDLNATFARFLRQQVEDVPFLMEAGVPVLSLFDRPHRVQPDPAKLSRGPHPWLHRAERARQAEVISRYLRTGNAAIMEPMPSTLAANVTLVRGALIECRLEVPPATLRRALGETAEVVNYLPRTDRESIWKRLSSSCSARLSPTTRRWLDLHAAVASEDGKRIARAAEVLLADEENLASDRAPYLVAASMSGLLLSGEPLAAMRVFNRHRHRLAAGPGWQTVFRFLVGQATGV